MSSFWPGIVNPRPSLAAVLSPSAVEKDSRKSFQDNHSLFMRLDLFRTFMGNTSSCNLNILTVWLLLMLGPLVSSSQGIQAWFLTLRHCAGCAWHPASAAGGLITSGLLLLTCVVHGSGCVCFCLFVVSSPAMLPSEIPKLPWSIQRGFPTKEKLSS